MRAYAQKWTGKTTDFKHRIIYEAHFGPIPKGMHVHHKNEDTHDNRIENLELVTPGDHKKMHAKRYHQNEAGEWLKTCVACETAKPLSAFYVTQGSHRRNCKPCHIKKENERLKRQFTENPALLERKRQLDRDRYARSRTVTESAS